MLEKVQTEVGSMLVQTGRIETRERYEEQLESELADVLLSLPCLYILEIEIGLTVKYFNYKTGSL